MTILYEARVSSGFTQLVICVSAFTSVLIYGLLVPVLPFALSERVGISEHDVQKWNSILFGAYGAAITIGSVVFGWLGDLTATRKAPFMCGLILLAASTFMFALARSVTALFIARVVQGLSSAVSAVVGRALLLDKVGPERMGQAEGWNALAIYSGFFLGPIVGGILYHFAGWFWVFVPAFALFLVEIILRALIIEEDRRGPKRLPAHDEERQTLLPKSSGRIQETGSPAIDDARHLDCPAAAQASRQLRDDLDTLHGGGVKHTATANFSLWKLLTLPRTLVAMEGGLILNSFSGAVESVLPLYCRELFDATPSEVALLFIPLTLPCLAAPVAGKLLDRVGSKWPAGAAYTLGSISFIGMAFVVHRAQKDVILLLLVLLCLGVVNILAYPAMYKEVVMTIEDYETRHPGVFGARGVYSLVYGLVHSTDSLGVFVGSFYGGLIRELAGWRALCVFMAALSCVVVLQVVFITGGGLKLRHAKTREQPRP